MPGNLEVARRIIWDGIGVLLQFGTPYISTTARPGKARKGWFRGAFYYWQSFLAATGNPPALALGIGVILLRSRSGARVVPIVGGA